MPRLRTSPSGSATATAIVSAWTSNPINRTFFMDGSHLYAALRRGSFRIQSVTRALQIGSRSFHDDYAHVPLFFTTISSSSWLTRFPMRTILTAMGLLVFAQIVLGQNAPPSAASEKVLTIRISADGICTFLDSSTPCVEVGRYLLSKHLAQDGHVHIAVDRASKYEMVVATLKSLDDAGFKKVGFVNNDFLQ